MSGFSRRDFLSLTGSAAVAAMSGIANAAMGPNDKFDLVIKGGDVLDPSQSLRGKRDIGIRWGVIEAVEADIPAARASKTIDAAGKLVTPGLIDLHSHVYPYGSAIGIPADELVQAQATTTVVSAGDAGVNNLAALRRYIVAQSRARIYAFVHIANNGLSGFPVAELYNIDYAQVEACAMALAENPDFLLGVKVRMSENVIAKHGLEPLKRAHQGLRDVRLAGQDDGAYRRRRDQGVDVADPRSAAAGRRADALPIPVRRTSAASSPTSCRTASCCRRRWPPSSAA